VVRRAAKRVAALEEAALRCLYVCAGTDIADAAAWRLTATAAPISPTTLARREGARVITLDRHVARALPQHKMTSYAASIVGLREAIARGADEGLFVDQRGRILEGTNTNVFAIVDNTTLVTAPIRSGILPGIVRASVLGAAARLELNVIERPPTIEELEGGSFLTSSLTLLAPIRRIDGRRCMAPGRVFGSLRRLQ
jgi:branched-subunit amino acid aminotransferase/4-amino-4-deoxychorismate lyase